MGWFFRKSLRALPGIRVNLSKTGIRLSVGVPGARASIDMHGKARIYGGKGPIRFQKAVKLTGQGAPERLNRRLGAIVSGFIRRIASR
jgi:hypothetical protein